MQGFCKFVKLRVCDSHRRCVVLGFAGCEAPVVFGGTQRAALIWINSAIKHQAMAQKCCSPASPRIPPPPFFIVSVATEGRKELGEINREWKEGADIEGECSQHRKEIGRAHV